MSPRFKDAAALKEVFQNAGVDWSRPIVTSCGTGVTASVLAFALHLIDPQQAVRPSPPSGVLTLARIEAEATATPDTIMVPYQVACC